MSISSAFKDIIFPGFSIAKYALGKYIIVAASLLHLWWAFLLYLDPRAANATPLSILFFICNHSISELMIMLLMVSISGMAFLNFRLRRAVNSLSLTALLIPQQVTLIASAGAGIYAAARQHYADGTPMSWAHILADQSPNIVMAILYTVATFESLQPPKPYRAFR